MKKEICQAVEDCMRAASLLQEEEAVCFIEKTAQILADCYQRDNKVLLAGNGGSLCDAMHFAEELTGYFREERRALAAIALADPGHLTCVANDRGFDRVFERNVEALGRSGDVFIALTTSGESANLVRASIAARKLDLVVVGFLGKTGGALKQYCDVSWVVRGFSHSDRIQEAHMAAVHIVIEILEKLLFALEFV